MKTLFLVAGAAVAVLGPAGTLAQKTESYADDLSRVYEATQFIQAVKEGCDSAETGARAANEAAYGAWRKRHQSLLDELERRFIVLIRQASADQNEYSRNVGKYAGDALHHVDELKTQFLTQPRAEVSRQCTGFSEYLGSKDADLAVRYQAELKSIRRRKL